ncbi:7TM diverse intracellular signaling domain-containing protein [Tenacibaculum aiptasiae]|uniref:7TM diverse intracellular signaling domain-containing protein n=1 Tax=Tenacibaculum aiptasiae TaxID=426481 RepID=UPI00232C17E7|nr:7TM diverse intracellular signaling domain-containing protein [Tenacibaculum aiptasiae]
MYIKNSPLIATYCKWYILLFLSTLLISCHQSKDTPLIKDGTIDLPHWNINKNTSFRIQGKGLFYWKQFPLNDNDNFSLKYLTKADTIDWPPVLWTSLGYKSKGYGTYRIFIENNNSKKKLVLNIPRVLGGVEVWINGKKIKSHGKISKNPENEELDGRPLRIKLPREKKLDIMFLISDSKHRLGGGLPMLNTIQEEDFFEKNNKSDFLIEGIITFLILVFGVYQVINYLSFPQYKFFLFFGLFCLFGASRQLFIGEAIIYNFIPNIGFSIVQKMRYIGYYGGLAAIFLYQVSLFPGYIHKKIVQFCFAIAILGVVYVILVPIYYTTLSAPFFQVFGLIIILIGTYQMVCAIKDKKPFAIEIGISLFIMCLLLANDLLNAMMLIQTKFLITYSFLAFVFFQVIINKKIQKKRELDLINLSNSVEELSVKIDKKQEEISELKSESYKQIRSKEILVENLKKLASKDESISIQNIIIDIKSELLENAQLVKIKSELEVINDNFFERLNDKHPSLTKTDLEICSMIRMGLKRKEIASIRNTSLEAVKSSRFRLKKKLNLSKEEDLDLYIKSL